MKKYMLLFLSISGLIVAAEPDNEKTAAAATKNPLPQVTFSGIPFAQQAPAKKSQPHTRRKKLPPVPLFQETKTTAAAAAPQLKSDITNDKEKPSIFLCRDCGNLPVADNSCLPNRTTCFYHKAMGHTVEPVDREAFLQSIINSGRHRRRYERPLFSYLCKDCNDLPVTAENILWREALRHTVESNRDYLLAAFEDSPKPQQSIQYVCPLAFCKAPVHDLQAVLEHLQQNHMSEITLPKPVAPTPMEEEDNEEEDILSRPSLKRRNLFPKESNTLASDDAPQEASAN